MKNKTLRMALLILIVLLTLGGIFALTWLLTGSYEFVVFLWGIPIILSLIIFLPPLCIRFIIKKTKGEDALKKYEQKVNFFKHSETGEFNRQTLTLSIILETVLVFWNPFHQQVHINLFCYLLVYAGSVFVLAITGIIADISTSEYRDKLYKEQHFIEGEFKVISYGTKISAYIHCRTYEKLLDFCKSNNKLVIGEVVDEALVQYFKGQIDIKDG